ncbi:hypothetical protein BCR41DRAFT_380681 [Lobosporangium transversale]|uniref:Uncharacterized protein n=1 Tax=Lobosporangium transversale TaxID=64571 RepID=A0A1Y2GQC6_9FUNG|nr:hypothetical protein BCR41DRAFT_380681 [Lobosporangium transversale]ORZ19097.1 hypothetical protein BCR41DRAFT_380681 [Lobosporangium transversale]|eukprot:XP_021882265.1 hypothetical protein BCR41DRAFT_380681 [Lobosporangium transversale]
MSPIVDSQRNQSISNGNADTTTATIKQTFARIHSKLMIRPEESLPRDQSSAATLARLNNTIQVTRAVWNQLCGDGRGHAADINGSVPVAIVVSHDSFQMHLTEDTPKPLMTAIISRAVPLISSIDGYMPESTESECFVTAEFVRTYMPLIGLENQTQITIQKTDLIVLDEIILAATTPEAYEIISTGLFHCSKRFLLFLQQSL